MRRIRRVLRLRISETVQSDNPIRQFHCGEAALAEMLSLSASDGFPLSGNHRAPLGGGAILAPPENAVSKVSSETSCRRD
jgi:hypothetical protein